MLEAQKHFCKTKPKVPEAWLLFTPGFPLILNHQFSMANFKLTSAYKSHCPWGAGVGLVSPDSWCLQYRILSPGSPVSFLKVDGESKSLCSARWLILSCLHLRSPALNGFCSPNKMVKHSSADAACTFLPVQRRWVIRPQLQSLGYNLELCYLGSFSDMISHASGRTTAHKHPEGSSCCWVLPHQASRASERWDVGL